MQRHMRTGILGVVAAATLTLGGCGMLGGRDGAARPVVSGDADSTETVTLGGGFGLNLPYALAGFTREDTSLGHGAPGAVAGYAHLDAPGPVMATVHAHQAGGGGGPFGHGGADATATGSDAALDGSLAEVRHYYPAMVAGPRSDAYIVRFGAVQHGRAVTVRFTDLLAGARQPIAMRIETYCCLGGAWDYEYRFRAPADVDATALEHQFAAGIAWSRDAAGSIDRPE